MLWMCDLFIVVSLSHTHTHTRARAHTQMISLLYHFEVSYHFPEFCVWNTSELLSSNVITVLASAVATCVESNWNVMAHGDARVGKWRGNWRMEWVASTLHTTSDHGVSSITTADAHTSAASSRLNWHPRRFKWTHQFRRKTKSAFRACAITFQTQSTSDSFIQYFQ
jgi:hypothetical protein